MEKPKCPNCSSSHVLFTKSTSGFWCRRCGHQWAKKTTRKPAKPLAEG